MKKRIIYFLTIMIVTIVGCSVRVDAANKLNIDFDEPTYLRTALEYTKFLREGQYKMLAFTQETYEHPALYKILYGAVLLTRNPLDRLHDKDAIRFTPIATSGARRWIMTARYLSVFFGTASVFALALVNPLAAFFLSIQTFSVKYTSELYLEALPLLTSLLCALTYLRWFAHICADPDKPQRYTLWLALSGIFMGMTAASKYLYCVVGIAIVMHFIIAIIQKHIPRKLINWFIGWGALSVITFFVFDPYLWRDPLGRLIKSVTFHGQDFSYTQTADYPFWQPLRWLLSPASYYDLGPNTAFIFNIDILICILAIIGLPRFFQKKRLFFYWFVIGLFFLFVWQAKWPQYILIVLTPFSIAAAEGVATLWNILHKLPFNKKSAG